MVGWIDEWVMKRLYGMWNLFMDGEQMDRRRGMTKLLGRLNKIDNFLKSILSKFTHHLLLL